MNEALMKGLEEAIASAPGTNELADIYATVLNDATMNLQMRLSTMSWDEAAAEVQDFAPYHAALIRGLAERWHDVAAAEDAALKCTCVELPNPNCPVHAE